MTDEFNRYYIKIRTILERDTKTICEELITGLGSDAPAYSTVAKWVKRFVKGERMSMMTLDLIVRFQYSQIKISKGSDKLSKMIRIQHMTIS